jgi:hypothetical protein
MSNEQKGSNNLRTRLLKGCHIFLYLILIGITIVVYSHAKTTYSMADSSLSNITCLTGLGNQTSGSYSLAKIGVTGKYTIHSTTLNGNKTGDDLLALKACNPNTTDFKTQTSLSYPSPVFNSAGQCVNPNHFCQPLITVNYNGYKVHFVHNDTMNPTEEAVIVLVVGIVVIEIVNSIFKYIVLGKWL